MFFLHLVYTLHQHYQIFDIQKKITPIKSLKLFFFQSPFVGNPSKEEHGDKVRKGVQNAPEPSD